MDGATTSQDFGFPKSLYLIHPLFSTYELNPVAPHAQASVPVPTGLDLDVWIVPPHQEPAAPATEEVKEKKKSSSKKGKEEANGKKKSKTSSKKKLKQVELLQDGDVLVPVDPDVETPEERERVSISTLSQTLHCTNHGYLRKKSGKQKEGNN